MENISVIKEKCVGCRSCELICPKNCVELSPNQEGFLYPLVNNEKCIYCGLCMSSCPAIKENRHKNIPQSVWAFKNRDVSEIMNSASGGAADVATRVILQQNGIVYGAAYDEDFTVKHIGVTNNSEKNRLQSSKYVQSDTNNCYSKVKESLERGMKVLFTGTPCQIDGLYSYLHENNPNLFTLDLICHGVPSPKFFKKYLEYQDKKMKDKVIYFNFCLNYKRGWGTYYLIKTKKKAKTNLLSLDKYGKHFLAGDCYRECCYHCQYANIKRVGDITVGDYWGIIKSHPKFYSNKGVSCVFINTIKGSQLFEKMQMYGYVEQTTLDEGLLKQNNLVRPTPKPLIRETFYNNIDKDKYISKMKIGLQIKERIKSMLPQRYMLYLRQLINKI